MLTVFNQTKYIVMWCKKEWYLLFTVCTFWNQLEQVFGWWSSVFKLEMKNEITVCSLYIIGMYKGDMMHIVFNQTKYIVKWCKKEWHLLFTVCIFSSQLEQVLVDGRAFSSLKWKTKSSLVTELIYYRHIRRWYDAFSVQSAEIHCNVM